MIIGIVCGTLAALAWAAGFVVAKHGITDRLFARRSRVSSLLLVRPADAAADYTRGITRSWRHRLGPRICDDHPVGTAAVLARVQRFHSCSARAWHHNSTRLRRTVGLVLASLILHEKATFQRVIGGAIIIAGLLVFGAESLTTIGNSGVGGDLLFATAGLFWATFGTLLRLWNVAGTRAVTAVGAVSVIVLAPSIFSSTA